MPTLLLTLWKMTDLLRASGQQYRLLHLVPYRVDVVKIQTKILAHCRLTKIICRILYQHKIYPLPNTTIS